MRVKLSRKMRLNAVRWALTRRGRSHTTATAGVGWWGWQGPRLGIARCCYGKQTSDDAATAAHPSHLASKHKRLHRNPVSRRITYPTRILLCTYMARLNEPPVAPAPADNLDASACIFSIKLSGKSADSARSQTQVPPPESRTRKVSLRALVFAPNL